MVSVVLRDIVRRYGDTAVVRDLSLYLSDGELVTLLGPSGCGKTTTLRMVAGFVEPDAGEIRFGDRPMAKVPPERRNTAMVFQSYALFPHMSVAENVRFGLRMRRLPRPDQDRRVAEALDLVSLSEYGARRPGQLSGGQQQRVALARAIATRPDVLLFDEPLSNLDAKLRMRVRMEIRDLQRRLGITTLYVTHDQDEALVISDRIAVMNGGRIEQVGTPEALYRRPATAFVADFLGHANILDGRIVAVADGIATVDTPFGRFRAEAAPDATSGPARICFRPEDVRLGRDDAGAGIDAMLRQRIYRGSITELQVEAGGSEVRIQVDGGDGLAPGSAVVFHVPADRVHVVG